MRKVLLPLFVMVLGSVFLLSVMTVISLDMAPQVYGLHPLDQTTGKVSFSGKVGLYCG